MGRRIIPGVRAVMDYICLLLALGLTAAAAQLREEKEYLAKLDARAFFRSKGFYRNRPRDCYDIQQSKHWVKDYYTIYPEGTTGFRVRCDLTTLGGGWTVIQRRISASDFKKTWVEYQVGFGNLTSNFWLGNEQIHAITSQGWYELRVEMANVNGSGIKYAAYNKFKVGDADSKYKLTVDGYHGDAGDSLTYHNRRPFTTLDRDNDDYSGNCAVTYKGAWWYTACHVSNLNGEYGNDNFGQGVNWHAHTGYHKSLDRVEMKVRKWMRPLI